MSLPPLRYPPGVGLKRCVRCREWLASIWFRGPLVRVCYACEGRKEETK